MSSSVKDNRLIGRYFELLSDEAVKPMRATENSAGYDIYCGEDITIPRGCMKVVPTGVTVKCPGNEFLDLRIRSGLSTKGLMLMNGCGVIDADYYPNEIKCIIFNMSVNNIDLHKGDRIAQGIFSKYEVTTDDAEDHKEVRTGGLGSTGGN